MTCSQNQVSLTTQLYLINHASQRWSQREHHVSCSVARHDAWLGYTSSPSRTCRQCLHSANTRLSSIQKSLFIACFRCKKKKLPPRAEQIRSRPHFLSAIQVLQKDCVKREPREREEYLFLLWQEQRRRTKKKCTYRPKNSELSTRVYTVKQSAEIKRSYTELREGDDISGVVTQTFGHSRRLALKCFLLGCVT